MKYKWMKQQRENISTGLNISALIEMERTGKSAGRVAKQKHNSSAGLTVDVPTNLFAILEPQNPSIDDFFRCF